MTTEDLIAELNALEEFEDEYEEWASEINELLQNPVSRKPPVQLTERISALREALNK